MILVLGFLAAAILALWLFLGRKPSGNVVYDDTGGDATVLVSHKYRLKGKPDSILDTAQGFVPVEIKSSDWQGTAPRPGDRAQLLGYCLLTEETKGRVSHGLLRYPNREFVIPFSSGERREIVALLAEMDTARSASHVGRSHAQAQRCRRCGMRAACGAEALSA